MTEWFPPIKNIQKHRYLIWFFNTEIVCTLTHDRVISERPLIFWQTLEHRNEFVFSQRTDFHANVFCSKREVCTIVDALKLKTFFFESLFVPLFERNFLFVLEKKNTSNKANSKQARRAKDKIRENFQQHSRKCMNSYVFYISWPFCAK